MNSKNTENNKSDTQKRKEALNVLKKWIKNHPDPNEKSYLISGKIISPKELFEQIESSNETGKAYANSMINLIDRYGLTNMEKMTKTTLKSKFLKNAFIFHRKLDNIPDPWYTLIYFANCIPFILTIDSKNLYLISISLTYMMLFLLTRIYYKDSMSKKKAQKKAQSKTPKKTNLKIV